jgi:ketosteroid isomerase-like protein
MGSDKPGQESMMSEENKALAIRFIEAFSRGDAEATAACLAPEAVVHSKGFGKLSGSRTFEFIVGTAGAFKDVMPGGLNPQFGWVQGEGEHVACEFEGRATLANGVEYNNQYCFTFRIRGGKIVEVHEYYCTQLADDRVLPLLADIEAKRHAAQG